MHGSPPQAAVFPRRCRYWALMDPCGNRRDLDRPRRVMADGHHDHSTGLKAPGAGGLPAQRQRDGIWASPLSVERRRPVAARITDVAEVFEDQA